MKNNIKRFFHRKEVKQNMTSNMDLGVEDQKLANKKLTFSKRTLLDLVLVGFVLGLAIYGAVVVKNHVSRRWQALVMNDKEYSKLMDTHKVLTEKSDGEYSKGLESLKAQSQN